MRPIDKGADRGAFSKYQDAQKPLTELVGKYCSYCERWVCAGIAIEHKKPKAAHPEDEKKWVNFLLSCVNCNSTKGSDAINLDSFIWPDVDNTFWAFIYDKEGRVTPKQDFPDTEINRKIYETWKMVGLNRHEDVYYMSGVEEPSVKDERYIDRKEAWQLAVYKKDSLAISDTEERRKEIAKDALQRGMFSIWMTVFSDDADMKRRFIAAFQGTALDCFNANGNPCPRPNGKI
jgi:uncharacterized protein (TIGR02646 family)